MTARETNLAVAAESTLSSSLAAGATTINVTDTSSFPAVPFYVVIDPDVNASREVVLVDSSKSATTFVLSAASSRGLDGTADVAHSSGAKVAVVMVPGIIADLNDRIDAAYTAGGTDVAVADGGTGASTAAAARTNLGLAIGTDVQAHSAVLDATTASFTTADETKLDGVAAGATDDTAVNAHIADTADAHDASAVSVADAGGYFTGTDVEAALQEIGADLASTGSADRSVLPAFGSAITGLAAGDQLRQSIAGIATAIPYVADRAGSIVGLSVGTEAARTSGSLSLGVYKNGVATGVSVAIDATNSQYHYASQAAGTDAFVAGDRIDVRVTALSPFQPDASNEIAAFVTVEFD